MDDAFLFIGNDIYLNGVILNKYRKNYILDNSWFNEKCFIGWNCIILYDLEEHE